MVDTKAQQKLRAEVLSVLALSSRFDGPFSIRPARTPSLSFSTRSVESF